MTDIRVAAEQARVAQLLALADDYAQKLSTGLGWAPSARKDLKRALEAALAAQPEQQQGQGLVHPAMSTSGRTSGDAAPNAPSAHTPGKYPRIGRCDSEQRWSKQPPHEGPRCAICGGKALFKAHVEVSWFRGDDVVVKVCIDHKKADPAALLGAVARRAHSLHGSPARTVDGQMDNKGIPSHE